MIARVLGLVKSKLLSGNLSFIRNDSSSAWTCDHSNDVYVVRKFCLSVEKLIWKFALALEPCKCLFTWIVRLLA